MWTISYKGFYINVYIDKPECHISTDIISMNYTFKSLHSAKCAISKWINKGVFPK